MNLNLEDLLRDFSPLERNVDIVFVIDASKSMEALIQGLQQRADSFYDEFLDACAYQVKTINRIRFKVIWYRDFFIDGDDAYGESDFFEMPDERMNFKEYLNSIRAYGGSDRPRPSLAVLSNALCSDFIQEGDERRHIIVHFTDAQSYSFEEIHDLRKKCNIDNLLVKGLDRIPVSYREFLFDYWEEKISYPLGISMTEMAGYKKYSKLDNMGKRLLLITPEVFPWDDMEVEFDHTIRLHIDGMTKIDWEQLINYISYAVR